ARDVTIRGLYYEAEHITLTSFFPLGVSNHFTGKEAAVTVKNGTILALWERKAGLPHLTDTPL
ncbi:MAG: thiamine diphosphokinase, partial [Faecousia sp.]